MSFNKKASLEISIQAIVIIVLAMTLLGLGLGFIRGMFKNIFSIQEEVTDQVRSQIINQMITNDQKVSFPKTEINLDKGEAVLLTVGVRNKKDSNLNYKMRFTPITGPDGAPFTIENPSWFQFASNTVFKLSAAESDVKSIRLSVPRSVPSGPYYLTFEVIDDDLPPPDNIYAQSDLFIVIRG